MNAERTELAPGYSVSRLIRGGWQLAGGHGAVDRESAVADMFAFLDAGATAFDCADIYTGVEELIGAFRARLDAERGEAAARALKVHTKFVPDLGALATLDRVYVERIVDRSRARLGQERLDLVQFHWWDYEIPGMIETGLWLRDLQWAGKIDLIGGTNFNASQAAALLEAGVPLATMQVQYSLLDARPEHGLTALCARTGMRLLCYGALAGGFLSERWLDAEPPEPREPCANRSLVKYKLIIDEFGGWELFQALLAALDRIARKHGVGIANVAIRYVLDRPHVAGVIVGARYAEHLADNLRVFDFSLDAEDRATIARILSERRGPSGDTYDLERDREGPHGRIMRYDLNDAA